MCTKIMNEKLGKHALKNKTVLLVFIILNFQIDSSFEHYKEILWFDYYMQKEK